MTMEELLIGDAWPSAHELNRYEVPPGAHEINRCVREIERGHGTERLNHLKGDPPTRGGMGNLLPFLGGIALLGLLLLSVLGDANEDWGHTGKGEEATELAEDTGNEDTGIYGEQPTSPATQFRSSEFNFLGT